MVGTTTAVVVKSDSQPTREQPSVLLFPMRVIVLIVTAERILQDNSFLSQFLRICLKGKRFSLGLGTTASESSS
jgi:hypothetical protein